MRVMAPRALLPILLAVLVPGLAGAQDPPAPPGPSEEEVREAVRVAVSRLVHLQEVYEPQAEGREDLLPAGREWPYEGVYRVGGAIPEGYRVGGTAIACLALLEAPGFAGEEGRRLAFVRGLEFCVQRLESSDLLKKGFLGSYDVRGWAHAYGLALLLRAEEREVVPASLRERARAMIRRLIDDLEGTAIPVRGGWNYARTAKGLDDPEAAASPFMTAPTLLALFHARSRGHPVKAIVVERALATLEAAREESGAFRYRSDGAARHRPEAVEGACARMAACELVLHLAGRGSTDRVRSSVGAFFTHWEWLEKRRKQTGTHVPPYGIAPYYFHFGHTYAALAIEALPEAERPALRARLRELYWRTREESGGWNDRVFPRSEAYGTAMAVLGLIAPGLPRPAAWNP
jgi:hypothetical protein